MISTAIQQLVNYGLDTGLILPDDEIYIRNQLLMTMQLDDFTAPEGEVCYTDLESILKTLVDDAVARGVCEDNSTARDLFDTKLMGVLTPRPSIVRANFEERYENEGPQAATDWFYKFSQDTDYIRRYRIKRDLKWVTKTEYGDLDITINLSKPEKDPKAIAAAKLAPQSAYPKCQLCVENEGYAGRMNHPARENHRIIPLTINDSAWNLQYSPYVYYNEHCIVFNNQHTPMKIERATFRKLLDCRLNSIIDWLNNNSDVVFTSCDDIFDVDNLFCCICRCDQLCTVSSCVIYFFDFFFCECCYGTSPAMIFRSCQYINVCSISFSVRKYWSNHTTHCHSCDQHANYCFLHNSFPPFGMFLFLISGFSALFHYLMFQLFFRSQTVSCI